MLICDLHCDLPYKVADGRKIHSNEGHFAEDKFKPEHTYVQTFANFVDAKKHPDCFNYINSMILHFKKQLKETTKIGLVTDYKDLETNIRNGINSAILSIEGGEALDGKIENVEYFYNLGIRFLTLTWNYPNSLGESCKTGNAPLTDFGKAVLKEMNRVKMFADVSHLCEKGFWDVAELSSLPFVATHSNSKALCGHERNLTDEQFLAVKKTGGIVGINLCPYFLEENGEDADITSIVRHIEHFMSLGGEDILSLGGDLDGVSYLPKGISGIFDIDLIANELKKLNYPDKLIRKIMGENTLEFIKNNF
ncbi:MAG: dipeptidase [Clostridia bacterium]|nr:dipeptidase [Clostridia bacterium]